MKNQIVVATDREKCIKQQRLGWPIAIVSLGTAAHSGYKMFAGLAEKDANKSIPFFFLATGILGVWLIVRGMRTKALLADFRLYASILATNKEKSVEKIASATNQPLNTVMKKVNAMCRRHYFSGHLDYAEKRVIFESDASASSSVIHCPGCGAKALVEANGSHCAYCGSPLTAEN